MTPHQIARSGTEHALQSALFCWIRRKAQYVPELKWAFAIPNGGSRDAITAGKLKAEGVTPGIFDLFVPCPNPAGPGTDYHGLWIEMKKPGGRLSPAQKDFGRDMTARRYQAFVCYDWEEAVGKIAEYLGITADYPPSKTAAELELMTKAVK